MIGAESYTVVLAALQRDERAQSWVAGVFNDYSAAVEIAHIIVDMVLLHIHQELCEERGEFAAVDIVCAFLQHGEAPLILEADGTPVAFSAWEYAWSRAEALTSVDW